MTSTVNGTAHHEGDPGISWPVGRGSHDPRSNLLGQINAGGIGRATEFSSLPAVSDETRGRLEKQYLPGQPKSLSGIAIRAFLLGFVLSASVISAFYLVIFTNSPLWRLPAFLATLSLFHFLEFWTTARYNTRSAQISSFLLSQNGRAYNIAHMAAMLECLLTNLIFPNRSWAPRSVSAVLIIAGLAMISVGQSVRSIAMVQAGTNFNHIVQDWKASEHQLVTTGAYYYLRHPSYFGFFWWGLGTQLVLGNVMCFLGYAVVLWRFFSRRISGEEELLVAFFDDEYVQYRKRTGVWIPFIK
jgi:protein-S-isoprenylcysteine O-methyltransferase